MDRDSEQARQARAEGRRGRAQLKWSRLKEVEDDLDPIAGVEAVSLVRQLTSQSWSLSGKSLPRYERSNIPCRFVPGRLT